MYHQLPLQSCITLVERNTPCVLLDTARPDDDDTRSFLFYNPLRCMSIKHPEEVTALLRQMDVVCKRYWMAGYLAYEAAYTLEEKMARFIKPVEKSGKTPLGWFGVFREPFIFNHTTGLWNRPLPKPNKSPDAVQKTEPGSPVTKHSLSAAEYAHTIQSIKRLIARGHTYQINFTYDVFFKTPKPVFDLYCFLRENQAAPYCAMIKTNRECVLSFSPELLLRKSGRHIAVKPMKGTAARGRFFEEDEALRIGLSQDPKNRSENIMIVDLMRNDLGKMCRTGSVKVKRLFETETLPTLHQMTSTITGMLKHPMTYDRIIRGLFPSGSVTGAPKIRSMEIIESLEKGRRGVYCGAVGYISPKGAAVFSVPIRTLQKYGPKGPWRYRVGSGIVWDSKAPDEWRECAIKCGLLTLSLPDFEIFESFLWKANVLLFEKDHIVRFQRSARYFFYSFDNKRLLLMLATIKKTLRGGIPQKIRIFLNKQGIFRWDCSALGGRQVFPDAAPAFLSRKPIDERSPFLFNKTTFKPWYEKDGIKIRLGKCFDVIHINEQGKVTEGSRSNVFVRKGGMLYTPPVECGLLPGILRKNLLRRGKCKERVLTPKDLKKADAVYCGNSVRGLVRVKIIENNTKVVFKMTPIPPFPRIRGGMGVIIKKAVST